MAPTGSLSSRPPCSRPRPSRPPGAGTRRAAGTARPRRRRCAATRRGCRRRSRPISRTRRRGSTSRSSRNGSTRTRTARTRLRDFYFRRFRAEFRPAVVAWLAAKPLKNPRAPLTPFAMPQYRSAARDEATRLNAQADSWAVRARTNLQRSTNYVLGVVMFAAALFFAGMSTKLDAARGSEWRCSRSVSRSSSPRWRGSSRRRSASRSRRRRSRRAPRPRDGAAWRGCSPPRAPPPPAGRAAPSGARAP